MALTSQDDPEVDPLTSEVLLKRLAPMLLQRRFFFPFLFSEHHFNIEEEGKVWTDLLRGLGGRQRAAGLACWTGLNSHRFERLKFKFEATG